MRTLAIIKPDAVANANIGKIVAHLEEAGFKIRAAKLTRFSEAGARTFYEVHRERPFYDSLVTFMTSGNCMVMVLEHEDAVSKLRDIIGATDPAEAEEGTVRKLYARSKERNAIHASDSPENAAREVAFFFPSSELERLTR